MKEFDSIREITENAIQSGKAISQVIMENQSAVLKIPKDVLFSRMTDNFFVMRESVKGGFADKKSVSGLSGGQAKLFGMSGGMLISGAAKRAVTYALAISEHNACMGRIVAAPTAGSCGILPSVLIAVGEEYSIPDDKLVMGLFNAAGMGMVVGKKASVSGAAGGCQAECGTASAIAASALCEVMNGSPDMCASALAMAFKFIMGLVCDPVAGLVEVPCVKRNASGAVNALLAAEMALSGIKSAIPADEVIAAVNEVGKHMHDSLRETSLGGLAATDTARRVEEDMRRNKVDDIR